MVALRYDPAALSAEVAAALAAVSEDIPGLSPGTAGPAEMTLEAHIEPASAGQCAFDCDARRLQLHGATLPQMLRAFTLWRGFAAEGPIPPHYTERTAFRSIGLMLDASRNAVPTVGTVKLILRKMAMLGMNQLMLYTEDTYQVPQQPMIGYLRGAYTQAELREIDAHAATLGIEVIPCIQALAHLEQMLRWADFAPVRDTSGILLVDEPKTYELLEQMISAASAPVRSRRIHLGMDEAHDIGLGRYRELHGHRSRFDILSSHLKKVHAICQKLGLQPMIWSDMYFRLASATGDYYSADAHIKPELVPDIPPDLQLVYWDYYHTDPEFYRDFFRRHQVAQRDILFASGVWTWNCFWPIYSWAKITSEAGIQAARDTGVAEVFTTAWGDDGAEVDYLGMLPLLTHFAANAFTNEGVADQARLRRDFRGACDADWDAFEANGGIDHTPGRPTLRDVWGGKTPTDAPLELAETDKVNWTAANPSKSLLWQDPLLGLIDGHLLPEWGLEQHYRQLAARLEPLAKANPARHRVPLAMAKALVHKAELGLLIHEAYQRKDKVALAEITRRRLPAALDAVKVLHEAHRALWHELYKPFGWEVVDGRYGWLEARLQTAQKRLTDWLDGHIDRIDELEAPRLPAMGWWVKGKIGHSGPYRRLISASLIT